MNAFTSERAEKEVNAGRGGLGIHRNWRRATGAQKPRRIADHSKAIAGLTAHLSRHPKDKHSQTHLHWLLKA